MKHHANRQQENPSCKMMNYYKKSCFFFDFPHKKANFAAV